MLTLIADVEANGLLDTIDTIWQLSIIDDKTGRLSSFNRGTLAAGFKYLKTADRIVMHNGLCYDLPVLAQVVGVEIDPTKVIDTLVLSRLARPDRKGGHSLANWGMILGHSKPEHEEWDRWSPAMQHRCDEDCKIQQKVWHKLKTMLDKYPEAVLMEHQVAWETAKMAARGMQLDVDHCRDLASQLREEQEHALVEVREVFQPILVPKEASASKWVRSLQTVNKAHPLHGQLDPGVEYCPLKVQQFNPGSRAQVAKRLKHKYGWKPIQFTPGGAAEISEETLGDLDYPEAAVFSKYLKVEKLLSFLDGKNGWLVHERDGIVYPGLNPLGTVTGRPSCASPNLQQVPKDKRLRAAFRAREGRRLVGVDASSLELRALGHYLTRFDGGAFAREVVEGDVHARIRDAINFGSDDVGRGFTKGIEYGMIYGAGNPRLGSMARKCYRAQDREITWKSDRAHGGKVRKKVKEQIKGYEDLEKEVKKKAKKGWIRGLDGRRIWIRSDHSALNFLLQSAGIIIVKRAMVIAPHVLKAAGFEEDVDYWPVLWVHDEWQFEVAPERVDEFKRVLCGVFAIAGEQLGVRCRLDGEAKDGITWADTH
jgi:DNA polymerase-1